MRLPFLTRKWQHWPRIRPTSKSSGWPARNNSRSLRRIRNMTDTGYYPLPKERAVKTNKPARPLVRRVIIEYNNMEMTTYEIIPESYAQDILGVVKVILSWVNVKNANHLATLFKRYMRGVGVMIAMNKAIIKKVINHEWSRPNCPRGCGWKT